MSRNMKVQPNIAIIAVAALFCLGVGAQQQGPVLTSQDIEAASWDFQNYIDADLVVHDLAMSSLVNRKALPDGNRGYSYSPDYEVGTTPYTDDPHRDSLLRLREDVCSS